eukprot:g76763.t1
MPFIALCLTLWFSTTSSFPCREHQLELLKEEFAPQRSTCPARGWLRTYLALLRQEDKRRREGNGQVNPARFIITVGCNKGEDFIASMEAWTGNSSYSPVVYTKELVKKYEEIHFACTGHVHSLLEHTPALKDTVGYCIEPLPANVQLLKTMFHTKLYDPKKVRLLPFAMGAEQGSVQFPDSKVVGQEDGRILEKEEAGNDQPHVEVEITTVDKLLEQEKIDRVDFLSIDAEGHDSQVIEGMKHSLSHAKIRVFEFEYNIFGMWKIVDLDKVVDKLDMYNYECFWQGNRNQIWPLTGCWLDRYKYRTWSNILCVHREEALHWHLYKHAQKWSGTGVHATQIRKTNDLREYVAWRQRQFSNESFGYCVWHKGAWVRFLTEEECVSLQGRPYQNLPDLPGKKGNFGECGAKDGGSLTYDFSNHCSSSFGCNKLDCNELQICRSNQCH